MYLQATWYSAEETDTLVEPTKTRLRSIYSKQVCRISGSIGWFACYYSLLVTFKHFDYVRMAPQVML
jgi:hypothetical protein